MSRNYAALMLLPILWACAAENTDTVVGDASSSIAAADQLLDAHVAAVNNLDTLSSITAQEAKLVSDWDDMEVEIDTTIDEITADCEPDEDGKDLIRDMQQDMDQIRLHIEDHVAAHTQHVDCEECYTDEVQLRDQTREHLHLMTQDCDLLRDQLKCRDRDRDGT